MKFGLRYCNTGRYVDPGKAIELVQAGEEAGFESAWTVEHTVVPADYESAYPYSADGKMAGGTTISHCQIPSSGWPLWRRLRARSNWLRAS